MSELRRQAAAIVQGMHWTTRRDEESLQAMAAEMTDLGFRASRTVTKGQGLARGFEQRDPMGWLIPLYELGQALRDAGAWWTEALAVEGYEWDAQLHGRRIDTDFAQLAELGDVVTAELQRSEQVEAEGGGAVLLVPPSERPTTAAAAQPAEARHARPEYGGPAPTYRQRRRLAPFLWPAGVVGVLIAGGLVYAATSGHSDPTTTPAAADHHPSASAPVAAAGLASSLVPSTSSAPSSPAAPKTGGTSSSAPAVRSTPTSARTTAPSAPRTTATTAGTVPQVIVTLIPADGNPQIEAYVTVDTTSTAPMTLYEVEYGTTPSGKRTTERISSRTLSGKTAYAVATVVDTSSWCGDTVTVEATAGPGSAAAQTGAGC